MTEWRVLVTEPIDEAALESIADIADVTRGWEHDDGAALLADLDEYHAIVVRTFELDADLIDRALNLEVIAKHGVGLDNIGVEAATERNIPVTRVLGANTRAVAEHALTFLFAIRKRLLIADRDLRTGRWERNRYDTNTVKGQAVGLFGFGTIGREFARLLGAVGVECLVYDPYVTAADVPQEVQRVGSKHQLFDRADIVSVHAPLTPETRGAISTEELRTLGPDGILINTARGEIVDEEALIEALETDRIAGAGLDVFEQEPPAASNPLFDLDRVIVTPHIAGNTAESLEALSRGAMDNVRAVYDGRLPAGTANRDGLAGFDPPEENG